MRQEEILVVDDEPDLQMLILQKFRKQIEQEKYDFCFAEDGEEALEMLSEKPSVSLVLTDINMPRMDGLTLLENIQGMEQPDLKTVIVSAYGDMDNIRTAMNRGAYDFVTKPIDFDDLEVTIENTIEEIQRIRRSIEMEQQLDSLQSDLNMAAQIQQNILPQTFPAYPEDDRFEVFAKMMAAKHVGGDFYDYFHIEEDKLAFLLGDVSGKGMPAAIYMAVSRTMLKAIGSEVIDPARCLEKVNQMLVPESDMTTFVTVFYGVLDVQTGELCYANGGHNLPYRLSSDGEVNQLDNVGGLLLGKFKDAEFNSKSIQLNPGESILIYTDGVTEAKNSNDDFFEHERLKAYLENNSDKSLDNRVKRLFVEVMKFTGSATQFDDITALSVKYTGNGSKES
jgi:sigma-B regulation protein RsbU (phosphoserine phosphatase)